MGVTSHEKKAAGDLSRDQDAAEPGPLEAKESDEHAADAEENGGDSIPPTETPPRTVSTVLEREAKPLQRGRTLDSPLGPLPVRSLAAMAGMVVVSVLVYLVAWGLLGTVGLLLGWIPAVALGLLAGRELGRRAAA